MKLKRQIAIRNGVEEKEVKCGNCSLYDSYFGYCKFWAEFTETEGICRYWSKKKENKNN